MTIKREDLTLTNFIKIVLLLFIGIVASVIMILHRIVPIFPFLIIFDVYVLLLPLENILIQKTHMRFFMTGKDRSFKAIAIDLIPFSAIVLLIHLVYWQEVCLVWQGLYRAYFN